MAAITPRYFLKRSLQTVFLLWFALTFLFFFFRLLPGDYSTVMLFQGASPEAVEAFREEWGLNDPLHIQYLSYIGNLLQGNAGQSVVVREPVIDYVKMGMFNSIILVAPAITLGYILGSIYGVIAGMNRGKWVEKYPLIFMFFLGSFPSFFVAILMVMVFAGWLNIFPTSGIVSTDTMYAFRDAPWWRRYLTLDFVWHYALPFVAVTMRYLSFPSLIMRTSVIDIKDQPFVYFQRITGLSSRERLKNVAKHASLPVITMYPISLTRAIGGLVLIELVFNWPGIGYQLVTAVFANDYPVIQFIFFLVAAFVILANFLVDIVYGVIDPRVTVSD